MNKKNLMVLILIFCSLFLLFNTEFINVMAQDHDLVLDLNNNFEIIEISELEGSNQNTSAIDFVIPSTSWTVDDIELNFSNIEYESEIISVESNIHDTYKRIYNKNPAQYIFGQAVQLKLNYSTIIYGIYLYGYLGLSHSGTPQIEIRGYDNINDRPNNTLYGSTNLNISSTPGWYLQEFTVPISLNEGNYYLVLNGSSLPVYSFDGAGFWWAYNSIDPSNSELNTSQYINQWSIGSSGELFLYKIIQKPLIPFYPENNNMTVKIDENYYSIANGSSVGDGHLKITNLDYNPGIENITLQVFNNRTQFLLFNVSYNINIHNDLAIIASTQIQENINLEWTLTTDIMRHSKNDSVKFYFPINWENLTISRNEEEISSNITINYSENYLLIPNNTIIDDADWQIQAESPNYSFLLNAPKTEYFLGQELGFSLVNPRPGNYTFILIDAAEIEEFRITKTIPPENNEFTFVLPSSSPDGTYLAYIFWNNGTDAGVQVQEFEIKLPIPSEFDPTLLIIIGVIIGVIAALSIISYIALKKILNKRKYNIERVLQKCNDILNLNYLIVVDRHSGVDIYSQSFGEQRLDPSLISGFLQAIRQFGSEVSLEKGSKTIKIDYKDTIILMTEFVNIRLITNMKDNPSHDFYYDMESLAYDIYKNYGKQIDEFRGNTKQFAGIKELIEKNLNTTFIYPLEVVSPDNIKLNQSEKEMVKKAKQFMKEHGFDHIYSIYLLPENECSPKDVESVFNLISKGVLKPIRRS